MDEARRQLLLDAGVDVDEALGRFLGNEALMMKFLLRFPGDENFSRLKEAMAQSDAVGAFEAAHTLKGVVGNLSMKDIFRWTSVIVEDLRAGDLTAAKEKMPALEAAYSNTLNLLGQLE